MSAELRPDPPPPPQVKPRSSVERALVWSLILGLLLIVAAEARAHFSFSRAYRTLAAKIRRADNAAFTVTEEDVQSACCKSPASTLPIYGIMRTADREDIYAWRGLFKTRRMYVYYGAGPAPEVLFVTTLREPPPPVVRVPRDPPAQELPFVLPPQATRGSDQGAE